MCAAKAGEIHALAGKVPFTRADGSCAEGDHFCDWAETPPDPADTCFVANTNLRRAEAELGKGPARPAAVSAWDGRSEPLLYRRVDDHLHLRAEERRMLTRNGFVVLDRAEMHSYVAAYHDVFQEQLPVFISADSVLHSIFRSNDVLLEDIERHDLVPRLDRVLERLRAALRASAGVYPRELQADLDLYLAVPNALLHGLSRGSMDAKNNPQRATLFGAEEQVWKLMEGIQQPDLAEVELFGRARMIDFSQYVPRGHYAGMGHGGVDLSGDRTVQYTGYFQAMTWLQRLELNLVSRACRSSQPGAIPDPSETPREVRLALALAELVARSGVAQDMARFEEIYSTFGGSREDLPVEALGEILRRERIRPSEESAPARLRALIGEGHVRKARVHYMPELDPGAKLPVITTFFGARVPPDVPGMADALEAVKYKRPFGHDLLGVMLGHARARERLTPDAPFAILDQAHQAMESGTGKDLYGRWLAAVLTLKQLPQGTLPGFMKTPAYADLRLGSALVGYAQIRHNYVLLSAQGYDSYGCEIPDGFVEPLPELYARLADYARAARGMGKLPKGTSGEYFSRVEKVMRTLEAISRKELRGEPLGDAEKRWLGMVAEYTPVGGYSDSGAPPKYTGWYFDLFPDREKGASSGADFVADLGTSVQNDDVYSVGAEAPRLGVFMVETGGAPRVFVGPVAKGYERHDKIAERPTDETAWSKAHSPGPWTRSFLAPPPVEPPLRVEHFGCDDGSARILVQSTASLGGAELTLLDHHGDPASAAAPLTVGPEGAILVFDEGKPRKKTNEPAPFGDDSHSPSSLFEGLHLHVRDLGPSGLGNGPFDLRSGPSVYHSLTGTSEGADHLRVKRPYSNFGAAMLFGAMAPSPAPATPSSLR